MPLPKPRSLSNPQVPRSLSQIHFGILAADTVINKLRVRNKAWFDESPEEYWGPSYRKDRQKYIIYRFFKEPDGKSSYSSNTFCKGTPTYVQCAPDSELPLYINHPDPEIQSILKDRLSRGIKQVPKRVDLVLARNKLNIRMTHAQTVKRMYLSHLERELVGKVAAYRHGANELYCFTIEGCKYFVKYSGDYINIWCERDVLPLN